MDLRGLAQRLLHRLQRGRFVAEHGLGIGQSVVLPCGPSLAGIRRRQRSDRCLHTHGNILHHLRIGALEGGHDGPEPIV